MKKLITLDITLLFIIISLIITSKLYIRFSKYSINKDKIIIKYNNKIDNNFLYSVSINYKSDNKDLLKCKIDNSSYKTIDKCIFKVKKGKHILYLKNSKKEIKKSFKIKEKIEGSFSSSIDNLETYYLALNGSKKLNFKFDYSEDFNKNIMYKIDDENIIEFNDNTIYGKNVGKTKLKVFLEDGNLKEYNILVTDLITPPAINNDKDYLPCERYSKKEAELLDKILESRVKEGVYGSRGGVLAAARFITLEFPYSISYFNENGRLNNHNGPHIDAEGRYYHKGLYLDSSKYSLLEEGASTFSGPKMWGCKLYDNYLGQYRSNGFSCSGFVSWAMVNGGFDVGDVGAGDYVNIPNDLSDMGEHKEITYDYMKNGNYKVGDFIARDGHAALIIGIDENNIYTAESLPPKLKVYTYERYSEIVKDYNLTYIIEMDDIYKEKNANYSDMW